MRPRSLEAIVRSYYDHVDRGQLEALLALFHDDIEYERQGTPTIVGLPALRTFYESSRVIETGVHQLDQVLPGDAWVAVRGRFQGRLRDGQDVRLRFTDWHHFQDGKIIRRETLFPGRTV
ncbi:nuclear transport factor 2 family protein [Actinomadura rudentiformis]|uniref:Nuclear transport factor 2 family protein n=1 Tax=Actinomadura rudentiformis TaxID=359158 RepID=A0A6H9ZA49_9ACTN|nr:nuclear transport factor 2 family protein [Actinomadura rudentiformis]KAB2350994.1 nuclear transport factor 2 family protein [Actinomadura rudentiformis]